MLNNGSVNKIMMICDMIWWTWTNSLNKSNWKINVQSNQWKKFTKKDGLPWVPKWLNKLCWSFERLLRDLNIKKLKLEIYLLYRGKLWKDLLFHQELLVQAIVGQRRERERETAREKEKIERRENYYISEGICRWNITGTSTAINCCT